MHEFDWSSIPNALPFLWDGMKISLEITAQRGGFRDRLGNAAGAHAPLLRHASVMVCGGVRQSLPGRSAGHGAAVVLPDRAASAGEHFWFPARFGHAPVVGDRRLCPLRGGLLLGDHPCRHPVGAERPDGGGECARHDLRPGDAPRRAAASLPQHGAVAADAGDHPVSGHLAGLCFGAGRLLRRRLQGRRPRRAAGRTAALCRRRVFRDLLHRVANRSLLPEQAQTA
jgi:hypothetical protein